MRRRSLAVLCAAALALPLICRAQESARTLRLGWLRPTRDVLDDFQSAGIPAALQALFVGTHTFFMTDRRQIIALASERRLPSIGEWAEQVRE